MCSKIYTEEDKATADRLENEVETTAPYDQSGKTDHIGLF